jgi:hypothetical protein
VRAGLRRSETEYVWPTALVPPPESVRLIYLDLNHWIGLAKAAVGHRDGDRHRDALEAVREAKRSGSYTFPLSAEHYMEMSGIAHPRQRFDVAAVMEELSEFASLVSRTIVMRLEVEAAVDALARPRPQPYAAVPVLCQGVLQAFGKRGGLRVRDESGEDVTEAVRREWRGGPEQFDAWQADAERQLDRSVLRGPTDAEAPELRAVGWDPTTARRGANQRAAQEREQADRLAAEPRWRRGRLRDVVSARYVALEINEMLAQALADRQLDLEDVLPDAESARRFVDSMPSADVCVSLTAAAHRNPQTKWTGNDVFDIDALSVAVPYCDLVVTERHARHPLEVSGAPGRCGTTVMATLAELAAEIS